MTATLIKNIKFDTKVFMPKSYIMTEPKNRIDYVLSYVKIDEQRVLSYDIAENEIVAEVFCKKTDYAINLFDYLSSSELMISTAQVGHILIDDYIQNENFLYKNILTIERLKELRDNHEIYFIDMSFKFHKKLNAENYEMRMSIENFKRLKDNFIAKFNFNIGSSIKGTFIALVSNNSTL